MEKNKKKLNIQNDSDIIIIKQFISRNRENAREKERKREK